ncbi:MAG: CpaE family protein, partial [Propioniciclava sp.]
SLLDVRQSVSVADLAKVYQDLSATTVRDAVIEHESGIHLLLAPVDVRQTESVTPEALRAVIALLRREFDVILLDVGGYVSPIQAAGLELADETVVVTSPDVLSVRAMRKRILAWEALGVRQEGELLVLLNKVDKASIFPAEAVAKLTTGSVLNSQVPLSIRTLEPAINERDPRAVADVNWWKLMGRIEAELGLGIRPGQEAVPAVTAPEAPQNHDPRRGRRLLTGADERGASTLETTGMMVLVFSVAFLMWQVAVAGVAFFWLGQASTEATRSYAIKQNTTAAQTAARETMPSPFRDGLTVSGSGNTLHISLQLPPNTAVVTHYSVDHTVLREPS